MIATQTPEYRKLEIDSSNDLIEHDAGRGLGRYASAALHARNAGQARLRMGEITFPEGEYENAAEDWLSAAACFYLVPDPLRMRACLERVQQLAAEDRIAEGRRDIHEAISERESQLQTLEERLQQFWLEYSRLVGPARTASPDVLAFLIRHVREFPGSPQLHAEISGQALQLDRRDLAVEALDWAQQFDPESPHLAALRVSLLFAIGESERAVQSGMSALADHPEFEPLRFLVAQSLTFRSGPHPSSDSVANWIEARAVLQPLLDGGTSDPAVLSLADQLQEWLQAAQGKKIAPIDQNSTIADASQPGPITTPPDSLPKQVFSRNLENYHALPATAGTAA